MFALLSTSEVGEGEDGWRRGRSSDDRLGTNEVPPGAGPVHRVQCVREVISAIVHFFFAVGGMVLVYSNNRKGTDTGVCVGVSGVRLTSFQSFEDSTSLCQRMMSPCVVPGVNIYRWVYL